MRTKYFLLLILLITNSLNQLMAQSKFEYEAAWKRVEAHIEKGLPQSAMTEVKKIYAQAQKDRQDAQLVKALVFQSMLVQQVEEEDMFKNITSLEAEAKLAKEPAKQIIHSITADLYYSYFQNQRWKIYNRSITANFNKEDPETWSIDDFHRTIAGQYQASLQNPALLQKTSLNDYEPILRKGNQRKLRPTLFDLLAHKAITYYKTDEEGLSKPAIRFQINDPAAFGDARVFANQPFKTPDTASHPLAVLKIYQQLIQFHIADKDPAALLEADIERLAFIKENAILPEKENLYLKALNDLYTKNKSNPQAAQAGYLIAQWYRTKGQNYQPATGTIADRDALKKAVSLAKELVKAFPKSEGGMNAQNLLNELEKPTFQITVEKVNLTNQPFRSLIEYKNLASLQLRLILVDEATEKLLTDNNDYEANQYWTKLKGIKPVRTWQQALPQIGDYRDHSVEIKVDDLPNGKYILFGSQNADFSVDENPLAAAVLHVSHISFLQNGSDFFVLDRQTGKPLPNASVQVWHSFYDYQKRRNSLTKGSLLKTNTEGYFKLAEKPDNNRQNTRFDISYQKDRLFLDDAIYHHWRTNETKPNMGLRENARYFIFTDRSIYRPGQTIFFKAIGITRNPVTGHSFLYKPDKEEEVILRDANYQNIGSLKLKANEFGSFSGEFKLPETGMTGEFQLEIALPNTSTASFQVEEYKRPKFFVEFDKMKGTYELNETITTTGFAKAYAGNNIDGAKVSYRVYRQTRFLYPWLFWRSGRSIWPPYGQGEKLEITHGETTTDANGQFKVIFKAIPDSATDAGFDPAFDYTIEAEITDLNGETRTATNNITVGYKSLIVGLSQEGGINQFDTKLNKMQITTTNLMGVAEPTKVNIRVYSLNAPDRLMSKRYWENPDTTVMTKAQFLADFPLDEYRNESEHQTWDKKSLVKETSIDTKTSSSLDLAALSLTTGWYMVEATAKDKNGKEVKAVSWFALHSVQKNQLASPEYLVSYLPAQALEPGQNAQFIQGSSAKDLHLIEQIVKKENADETEKNANFTVVKLDKNLVNLQYPVTEADRGGYLVNRFFVKDNRFYQASLPVNVPWNNKDLKISFETFRNKLLPGQQEKWSVKITGWKGEAVAAEMLASMYDASLDQFAPHQWNALNIWQNNYFNSYWNGQANFSPISGQQKIWYPGNNWYDKQFDELLTINSYNRRMYRSKGGAREEMMSMAAPAPAMESGVANESVADSAPVILGEADKVLNAEIKIGEAAEKPDESTVQIRKNFQETAFFFPALRTNANGEISFEFTIPEALTQWKLQTLAHTRDLSSGMATQTTVTQKPLMVQPNAPRFFRQGDQLELVTKVVNLTDKELTGVARLELLDAATLKPVDGLFRNMMANQHFTVEAGKSMALTFPIDIPHQYQEALMYRIIAQTKGQQEEFSDGEEMVLPVLSNRMLVTESFPINMRNVTTKTFQWDKLLKSGTASNTLQHHSLKVEYTSNPVWYAVQALPYLMEYPYDCAEQTWNRFYANALAGKIANSTPKIQAVFNQWKTLDTAALLSNLQKNQELKALLLEETPWVLAAKTEAEQKRNIALLFDLVRMKNESAKALATLKQLQSSNGGFVWFKGGPDDRYMTQYILTGIGHLNKLNATPGGLGDELQDIISRALPYLDARMKEDYDALIRYKADLTQNHLSQTAIQYLYMRSFFKDQPIVSNAKKAVDYYTGQAKKFWVSQSKYSQGMIALAFQRQADAVTAKAILKSLTENSISHPEFGMYWKEFNTGGYYWYQAPIESQALLIEAYSEIENNVTRINDLRTWLLKQKQTQNWKTTKATAEACYALLLQGDDWLMTETETTINLGDVQVSSKGASAGVEAGTGYFSKTFAASDVQPAMGNIKVTTNPANGEKTNQPKTSWGAVYWQYFEDLDKITPASTPLQLTKKLFVERKTDKGPVLFPLGENETLKVGDKVKVRVELRTDRHLEYVHLKDMRASCFEPVNVLSTYKYQEGLGYYESTRDASTNFFISYMPKGTYVFEYSLYTSHSGDFSNGITSVQCMYAPEFASHSEGVRVKVK